MVHCVDAVGQTSRDLMAPDVLPHFVQVTVEQ